MVEKIYYDTYIISCWRKSKIIHVYTTLKMMKEKETKKLIKADKNLADFEDG